MKIRKEIVLANVLLLNLVLGAGLVTSLLSVYLAQIGISYAGIGLIFAFGAISAGFLRLLIGPCVDLIGKKKFIIIGAAGYPLFAIGLALAKTAPQFIGLDIILELFGAIFWTAFLAYYYDIVSKGREGVEIAEKNIVHYAAIAASPFLAGVIAERFGFTNLFYIGAIISAIAVPLAIFGVKDLFKSNGVACLTSFAKEYNDILKIKGFKTIFLVIFMNTFTWAFWAIYMPVYLDKVGFNYSVIGLIISVTWLVGALIQYPLGKAIDKFPAKYILIPGFGMVLLGSMMFFWMKNFYAYLIGRTISGVGWDLSYWPAVGVFVRNTPKKEHGGGWAFLMAGAAWAYGIGSLAGGFLTQSFGIEKVLWASAILAFATGIVLLGSKVLAKKGEGTLKKHHAHHHIRKIQ